MLQSLLLSTALSVWAGNVQSAAVEIGPPAVVEVWRVEWEPAVATVLAYLEVAGSREENKYLTAPIIGVVEPRTDGSVVTVGKFEVIFGPFFERYIQTKGGMVGQQPTDEKVC